MYKGLGNSRRFARHETVHPWETAPEGVNSELNENSNQNPNQEQKTNKISKLKSWIKAHKPLAIGIFVAILALIAGAIVGIILLIQHNASNEEDLGVNGFVLPQASETMTVETSLSPELAYEVVVETFDPVLMDGILDGKMPDLAKMEDNYVNYVANVESERDKTMYYLYFTIKLSLLGGTERAGYLLSAFDAKGMKLDDKQRYMYLNAYMYYYMMSGDIDNENKYLSLLDEEFPNNEDYYDVDTGELITDKEALRQINYDFDRQTEEYNNENSEEAQ